MRTPPALTPEGRCPPAATPAGIPEEQMGSVRLTVRDSRQGTLLCDAILPLDRPASRVGVPRTPSGQPPGPVDVILELFDTGGALAASGETRQRTLRDDARLDVLLTPTERFACTVERLARGRAFHSATTLPNGEVLIVGGLVPAPGDPGLEEIDLTVQLPTNVTGGFYVSSSVEIYDPSTGTFREVAVPELQPRAFHQAYVVPSPTAGIQVILVGGVTTETAASPAIDGVRDRVEPLRLVPTTMASGATTEVLTYDPPTGNLSRAVLQGPGAFDERMFQAATSSSSPPSVPQAPAIVAGGWLVYPSDFFPTFEAASPTDATSAGAGNLAGNGLRVGATVTRLDDNRAVLWGGNLGSPAGTEADESGNLLSGFAGGPLMAQVMTYDAASSPVIPRAWHAAAALDDSRVLVVGGFEVAAGTAFELAPVFAQIVSRPPFSTDATVTDVPVADVVPVGYPDAVPLLDGDILVTGGNPATGNPNTPCPDGEANLFLCSDASVYRYDHDTDTMARFAEALNVPRWGHRSAVLSDGTVLITGGFRFAGGRLFVVPDAETFNPRTAAHDPIGGDPRFMDGTFTRAPAEVAKTAGGEPFAECLVIE